MAERILKRESGAQVRGAKRRKSMSALPACIAVSGNATCEKKPPLNNGFAGESANGPRGVSTDQGLLEGEEPPWKPMILISGLSCATVITTCPYGVEYHNLAG